MAGLLKLILKPSVRKLTPVGGIKDIIIPASDHFVRIMIKGLFKTVVFLPLLHNVVSGAIQYPSRNINENQNPWFHFIFIEYTPNP